MKLSTNLLPILSLLVIGNLYGAVDSVPFSITQSVPVTPSSGTWLVTAGSGSWLATPNGTYSVTPTTGTYLISSTGTLTVTQGPGSLNLNFSSGTYGSPLIVASTSGFIVTAGSGTWPITTTQVIPVTPTTGTYYMASTGTLSVVDSRGVYPVTPTTGTYLVSSTGTLTVTQGPGSFNLNFSSGTYGNPLIVASTSGFIVAAGSGTWPITTTQVLAVTPTTGTYYVASTGVVAVVDQRGVYPVTPTTGTYTIATLAGGSLNTVSTFTVVTTTGPTTIATSAGGSLNVVSTSTLVSSTGPIHVILDVAGFNGSTPTFRSMYGNNASAFVAYSTGNLANQSTFFAMLNVSGSTSVARIRSIALSPITPTTIWTTTQTFNLTLITGIQAGQAVASNTAVNSVYLRQMDSNDAPLNTALWIATGAIAPTGIGKMAFNAVTIGGNNTNMPFQPTFLWNADSAWHDPLTLRPGQGFLVWMSTTGSIAPAGFLRVTTIFTQE